VSIRIETLEVDHFLGCRKARLDFRGKDYVYICGDNGQGKSSIVRAIGLCLTGKDTSAKFQEFVHEEGNESHIKMTAVIDGNPISFDYKLMANGGTNKIVEYGGSTYKQSQIDDLLKNELELTYYNDVLLSKQGDGDVTRMSSTERYNFIKKMFDIDFSEQSMDIKSEYDNIKKTVDENSAIVRGNEREIANLNSRKRELKELPKIDYEAVRIEVDLLEKRYNKEVETARKILEKTNELRSIEKDIANLADARARRERDAAVEAERKRQNEERLKEAIELETQAALKKQDAIRLSVEKRKLENEVVSVKTTVNECLEETSRLKSELVEAERRNSLITSGMCPECGKPTNDMTTTDLSPLKEKLETSKNAYQNATKNRDSIQAEFTKISTDYDFTNREIGQLENRAKSLRVQERKITRAVVYDDSKEQELLATRDELQNELDEMGQPPDSSNTRNRIDIESQRLVAYDKTLRENELLRIANEADTKRIEELEIEIEKRRISNVKLENELQDLKSAREILEKHLPAFMVTAKSKKIENDLNDFVRQVFSKMTVTLDRKKDGLDFFYTNGLKRRSVNFASGFEREAVSVGFRAALCSAYDLGFMVLDECDSMSSPEGSAKLFEALSSGGFEQVFIISHKPETIEVLRDVANDVVVYRAEKGIFRQEAA
jgi:DNA repair exonuclease SbcCD ATPase subunit